eukprot:Em0007g606a
MEKGTLTKIYYSRTISYLENFAINEEKVVVSNILRRFELRADDSHCIEMDPKIILRAKYDIKLHLKPLPSST